MKKITALLLIAAICLSLAACTSETDKALAEARSLMEAGDLEGAEQVIAGDENYQQLSGLMEQIRMKKAGLLIGKWVSLDGDSRYEFKEDGTVTAVQGSGSPETLSFRIQGEAMELGGKQRAISRENDIPYIGALGEPDTLVREENYEQVVQSVEITMDNWQDYFDLVENVEVHHRNDLGEVDRVWFAHALVLKDAYADRYIAGDAAFEITALHEFYYLCKLNPDTMKSELTKLRTVNDRSECPKTFQLVDWRKLGDAAPDSEVHKTVSGIYEAGVVQPAGGLELLVRPYVTAAQGSILLTAE